MEKFHLHLISDATGETVQAVGRACLAQFEGANPTEHIWTLVRNERQIEEVIKGIEQNPGSENACRQRVVGCKYPVFRCFSQLCQR